MPHTLPQECWRKNAYTLFIFLEVLWVWINHHKHAEMLRMYLLSGSSKLTFPSRKMKGCISFTQQWPKKNVLSVSRFMQTCCLRNNVKWLGHNARSMGGFKVTSRSVKGQWLRPEDDWEVIGMEQYHQCSSRIRKWEKKIS